MFEFIAVGVIVAVAFIAWQYLSKQRKLPHKANTYWIDGIPSIFPLMGLLLTMLGVLVGLWSFDSQDVSNSIPNLLDGLKFAFLASMAGVIGAIVFQWRTAWLRKKIEDTQDKDVLSPEAMQTYNAMTKALSGLEEKLDIIIRQGETSGERLQNMIEEKITPRLGSIDNTIVAQTQKVEQSTETLIEIREHTKNSAALIYQSVEVQESTINSVNGIASIVTEGNQNLHQRLEEFSDALKRSNTEALVEVMQGAVDQFKKTMADLLSRLVKESFDQLNTSVNKLNTWQQENKEQISQLTASYNQVVTKTEVMSTSLQGISRSTESLVSDSGKLAELVRQVDTLLKEDGHLMKAAELIENGAFKLNDHTGKAQNILDRVNGWVQDHKRIVDGTAVLITSFEELKDFNSDVWDGYRSEMKKAVEIVKVASERLKDDFEQAFSEHNKIFMNELNTTFQNLSSLMTSIVEAYTKRIENTGI